MSRAAEIGPGARAAIHGRNGRRVFQVLPTWLTALHKPIATPASWFPRLNEPDLQPQSWVRTLSAAHPTNVYPLFRGDPDSRRLAVVARLDLRLSPPDPDLIICAQGWCVTVTNSADRAFLQPSVNWFTQRLRIRPYTTISIGHLIRLRDALCHYYYPESARREITPGRATTFCLTHGRRLAWVPLSCCDCGARGTAIDKS
jgi:hypothetical protein